jgi:hypothetical protein
VPCNQPHHRACVDICKYEEYHMYYCSHRHAGTSVTQRTWCQQIKTRRLDGWTGLPYNRIRPSPSISCRGCGRFGSPNEQLSIGNQQRTNEYSSISSSITQQPTRHNYRCEAKTQVTILATESPVKRETRQGGLIDAAGIRSGSPI